MGLSLSQSYLLCMLNKRGKISGWNTEKAACLTASCVIELLLDQKLCYEKKRWKVVGELPEDRIYLLSVFECIKAKQPIRTQKILDYYFSGKHMRMLTDAIGGSLAAAGCVQKKKTGIFRKRNAFMPDAKAVESIGLQLRTEYLEEGKLTAAGVVLAVLLDKCGDLKRFFTSHGRRIIKKRLKEIRRIPQDVVARVLEVADAFLSLSTVDARQ